MRCALLAGLLALAPNTALAQTTDDPDAAPIVTSDIPRFWRAWDRLTSAASREDSLRALFEEYYLGASPGLEDFIGSRIGSVYALLGTVKRAAGYYRSMRPATLRAATFEGEIRRVFRALDSLYPEAVFPPTYLVIGRMTSGGTTSPRALLIGVEMYGLTPDAPMAGLSEWHRTVLKPVEAVPHIVAHELIHYQQRYPEGQPVTLLSQSIKEGIADLLAELISGRHINANVHQWANPREGELWTEFQSRMHEAGLEGWLYGGAATDGSGRPADLGYWMGYRIGAAYYAKAADKRQAIRDMLTIRDFTAFLRDSGYDPGR